MTDGGRRRSVDPFLRLFALNGFVVVQPVLDVMGRSPELFVLRRASRLDIVLLAAGLVVLPPLVLLAVEGAVGAVAGRRAARVVHLVILTGLLALLAVQVLRDATGLRDEGLAAVAAAVGAAAAVAVLGVATVRTWLRYLVVAPLAFALLFLVVSPTSKLVVRPDVAGATGVDVASDSPPVVMVVFDELPLMTLLDGRGRIDERLFPSFARLASTSTWFRNATTVNGYTSQALPAMLTGRFPHGRAPLAIENPANLFTLLGGAYDVVAYEAVTALCPPALCERSAPVGATGPRALAADAAEAWRDIVSLDDREENLTDSFLEETDAERDARRDAFAESAREGMRTSQPARFTSFLDDLAAAGDDGRDRPALWFLHLLMPHTPWRYLPSGMQYEPHPFGKEGDVWIDEPWVTTHHQQRHLLQATYTDQLLGQVLDRLEEQGIYDEALVVVAADHGAGFTPGEHFRGLGEKNIPQLAWVPLLVKSPGQTAGDVRDDNVMTVDVLPTVADVVGVDLPWAIDGISMFGPPRTTDQKRFVSRGDKIIDGSRWLPEVLRGSTAALGVDADEPDDLFRIGPHADVVGTAVPAGEPSGRATVNDLGAFDDVRPTSGKVPALVTGTLQTDADADAVAIALNGTVVAVSDVFGGGPRRFAAIVPDRAFVPGPNRLDVLTVAADGELTPVRVRG